MSIIKKIKTILLVYSDQILSDSLISQERPIKKMGHMKTICEKFIYMIHIYIYDNDSLNNSRDI